MASLVIASRTSKLAMAQAQYIQAKLEVLHPDLALRILGLKTQGDKILNVSLSKIGGKGLFIKELESALLQHEADLAVHSAKDLPFEWANGLEVPVICAREDPRDVLVCPKYKTLDALPTGAIVGTSSLRRQMQLLNHRPDLICKPLRGNVITRLEKLAKGEFDAIILAAAGLVRIHLEHHITQWFDTKLFLPAVGQGALGLQCRNQDKKTLDYIEGLKDSDVADCVLAERAMNLKLHGSCSVPIAGFATLQGDTLFLQGRVGTPDGKSILHVEAQGSRESPEKVGYEVAQGLIEKGAKAIIASCDPRNES